MYKPLHVQAPPNNYKPPPPNCNTKKPSVKLPLQMYTHPGGLMYLEFALEYKVKTKQKW